MCVSFKVHKHTSLWSTWVITGLEMGTCHERIWSIPLLVSCSRCSSHVKLLVSSCRRHLFINQRYGEFGNDEGKGESVELTKE